ncbi:MAG: NADH-quinone oxidoreductase subunit H [Myxococcales bacterium]|nr:NADH-quinone oxidoreductase subunit H [Myxococcales bacterium]
MGLILLFLIPTMAFAGMAVALVGIIGAAIPWIASHPWGAWAMDPWFQALIKLALLVLLVVMPIASLLTWMERKQSAMMQDRIGPNRAGILGWRGWGIPHFIADAFGATVCPHQLLQVVTNDAMCKDAIPLQTARLDVGLIFYFAVASLAVYGTTLAGWASYNKWSLLGGLRASSQMMSYEVTMGMAILGAFLVFGTLEPNAMVLAQGPNPIDWGIVKQPLGAVLFFTAAMAETKRTPFDLPEGENEVIGYFVEYSGMRFGIFFLAEFIEVVFLSAIMATVFFGGWQVPFLYTDGFHLGDRVLQMPHVAVLILQTTAWGLKVIIGCWFQLLVRWTMPRFRPDQLMNLGWKRLLPISLANILITAFVVLAIQAWGAH